jgi:hypothetical protein
VPKFGALSALLAASACLSPAGAHAAEFGSIDRVVAVVGARSPGPGVRLVLQSDVALRARLALLADGDPDALSRSLPESLQEAVLSQVLGELMLATEAERLSMAAPESAAVSVERGRLALSVGGERVLLAALEALDVPPEELGAIVLLRATVGGFLDANLERVSVSDADVAAALAEQPESERSEPEQIRAQLRQERVEGAVASWVTTLAQRVPHRVLD